MPGYSQGYGAAVEGSGGGGTADVSGVLYPTSAESFAVMGGDEAATPSHLVRYVDISGDGSGSYQDLVGDNNVSASGSAVPGVTDAVLGECLATPDNENASASLDTKTGLDIGSQSATMVQIGRVTVPTAASRNSFGWFGGGNEFIGRLRDSGCLTFVEGATGTALEQASYLETGELILIMAYKYDAVANTLSVLASAGAWNDSAAAEGVGDINPAGAFNAIGGQSLSAAGNWAMTAFLLGTPATRITESFLQKLSASMRLP